MGLSELEESCVLLDEKVLRFMEQLEVLEEKRAALNSLIEQVVHWRFWRRKRALLTPSSSRDGFQCSKARYSLGNNTSSTLQYAKKIKPVVHVHTRTSSEGVRRRLKPKKDASEKELSVKVSNEEAPGVPSVNRSDQIAQQDPLKWFGNSVPQSLKQAQSSFKQVIELSAEIATLQFAVLHSRQE
ncbi:LOW QUALITY PROTEIN: coiled-coil domain-containing protein 115 [Thalassophryne amazonica]|uniref:LOW QUALITY PROTEIN: coiled-coil domain-containing protein 115 n=1 Tax=Thalassophryne amazonica TaxID=390379 RepID=UPI0014708820|nr:LOW QUALITY PROTEIN: coiled-coil domain-containing protein 115 [Thalassophryne amazonica]